jgi:hypothetical protein
MKRKSAHNIIHDTASFVLYLSFGTHYVDIERFTSLSLTDFEGNVTFELKQHIMQVLQAVPFL